MSVVTNLILTFSIVEDEIVRIAEVNAFKYRNIQMNLVSADFNKDLDGGKVWYGGTKFLETPLYIGAFNHLDLNSFIGHLKEVKWESPEQVQIIVKEQFDDRYKIIELTD